MWTARESRLSGGFLSTGHSGTTTGALTGGEAIQEGAHIPAAPREEGDTPEKTAGEGMREDQGQAREQEAHDPPAEKAIPAGISRFKNIFTKYIFPVQAWNQE